MSAAVTLIILIKLGRGLFSYFRSELKITKIL